MIRFDEFIRIEAAQERKNLWFTLITVAIGILIYVVLFILFAI